MSTSPPSLAYVQHLQDTNKHAVGFLPTLALQQYADRNQLWLATENDDPCGYLLFGSNRRPRLRRAPDTMRVIQACLQYDARRVHHATRLVRKLIQHSTTNRYTQISLWCASDLEANQFWSSLGFTHSGTRLPHRARKAPRLHNRWILDLPNPFQPLLFR